MHQFSDKVNSNLIYYIFLTFARIFLMKNNVLKVSFQYSYYKAMRKQH